MYLSLQEKQQQEETYARLTAPYHLTKSHFSEHQSVQGMYKGEHLLEGSDRLLLVQSSYGAMQLGFSAREGRTFLFAHAARMAAAPRSVQARLYHHPRHNAMLYQTTDKPWSAHTLSLQIEGRASKTPTVRWLSQQIQNQKQHTPSAYQTLFPFAQRSQEVTRRALLAQRSRAVQAEIRDIALQAHAEPHHQKTVQTLRTEQRQITQEQAQLASILFRKDAQSLWFFQQANQSFDCQKQEIFAYYKTNGAQATAGASKATQYAADDEDEDAEER